MGLSKTAAPLRFLSLFSLIYMCSSSATTSSCKGNHHQLQNTQKQHLPFMTSDPRQLKHTTYDYIIIGGGTTGCPLAATLSTKHSVLIIERGGSPYGNPLIQKRKNFGIPLLRTDEFSSIAQEFVSLDGVVNHRGRVLGGSTAINTGFYGRASDKFVKRLGWDKKMVKEAYKWVESKVAFEPELSAWQSVVMDGLLEAGVLPFNGYSLEHVEGTKVGATLFDVSGNRHTAADLLQLGNVSNINVLLNSTVSKIIFQSSAKGGNEKPRAKGVKLIESNGKPKKTYKIYLKKNSKASSRGVITWSGDIILSAGAISSPQMLMLSGIGPSEHLKKFNIPIISNLRGVGQRMVDNPAIAPFIDTKPQQKQADPPQVSGITDDYQIILESATIPINKTIPNLTRTTVAAKFAFPESKGELELNTTDPRENPLVRFNYLAKDKDMQVCVKMGKLVKEVAMSESVSLFLGYGHHYKDLLLGSDNEEDIKEYCKKNVVTFYHYHGGCVVGLVVDKDYKVYGVEGLRVVDGSTLDESPGTNPMATLMMLGRYQGLQILNEKKAMRPS